MHEPTSLLVITPFEATLVESKTIQAFLLSSSVEVSLYKFDILP